MARVKAAAELWKYQAKSLPPLSSGWRDGGRVGGGADGGIVKQERDNGGEPCFFGWEPLVRRKAGGRILDEVSALPSVTTPSLHPSVRRHQSSLLSPPILHRTSIQSLSSSFCPYRFLSIHLCYFSSDSSCLFVCRYSIFSLLRPEV